MAAFLGGAGAPETLTSTQRQMYLDNLGHMLYLRDRVHLDRQFAEMGPQGWADLVSGKDSGSDPIRDQAHAIYTMRYGVGDAARIGVQAARDFRADSRAGSVPDWVVEVAPLGLIAAINRANEEEVSDDHRRRRRRKRGTG